MPRPEIARLLNPSLILRWVTARPGITSKEMAEKRFGPPSKRESRHKQINKTLATLEKEGKVYRQEILDDTPGRAHIRTEWYAQ